MSAQVTIQDHGRSGAVTYQDEVGRLQFHSEVGGGDVVAIVQCGDAKRWEAHPWARARRAEILRFVADEVIRQKAPGCTAAIDVGSGDIVLRKSQPSIARRAAPAAAVRTADDVAWYYRFRAMQMKFAIAATIVSLIFAGALWLMKMVLEIDPGKGTPIGLSVRLDNYVATLIQNLEPYVPSLNRNHGNNTYRLSLLLVPLDGSATKLIPIKGNLAPNSFSLAKILGSDGRTIWLGAAGLHGLDLGTFKLMPDEIVANVDTNSLPRPHGNAPFGPKPEHYLAAGFFTSPTTWLGLHSAMEVQRDFKPRSSLKRVVAAETTRQPRQFHRGVLEGTTSSEPYRIQSISPLGDTAYHNAAFLRRAAAAEPIQLSDPPSALMIHNSSATRASTLVVARVDFDGVVQWEVDTGIDHFNLGQILPGEDDTAFIGTRPPVLDRVSEPLLVIVEHASGKMRSESLWR